MFLVGSRRPRETRGERRWEVCPPIFFSVFSYVRAIEYLCTKIKRLWILVLLPW